jgi:hypothetical protein
VTDHQLQVEVSLPSVARAWKASGYDDFWLRLRTKVGDLDPVQGAIEDANDAAAREFGREASGDGVDIGGFSLTPCPGGFALEVGPALERHEVHWWVQRFASALERHGVSGRLDGAPQARVPDILDARMGGTPTLFARFELPAALADGDPQWEVEPVQTGRIVHTTVDWALTEPGSIILIQSGFSLRVDGIELQEPMQRALRTTGRAGVDVFDTTTRRVRHAVLGPRAVAVFQSIGRPWRDNIEELRDLAISLPPPLDVAFVRTAHRGALSVLQLDSVLPLDGMREDRVRVNMHLLDRYVPDAHGIQIVGQAHLDAAHDLSEWDMSDLGQGRYLVSARDLEPWYGAPLPDPDAVEQARSDWAGAIITERVIAANRAD